MSVVPEPVAGRAYARVYTTSGRADLHAYLLAAVARSGGRVLYASSAARAPVYLGVQTSAACLYPPTRQWTFAFQATSGLARDRRFSDRLAPLHRVTDQWPRAVADVP